MGKGTKGPTRMSVSEETSIDGKLPPKCKEKQLHKWDYNLVKFTYLKEDLMTHHVDTYYEVVCTICRRFYIDIMGKPASKGLKR